MMMMILRLKNGCEDDDKGTGIMTAMAILMPKRERGTNDPFGVTCHPPTRVHCF